jgi:hypothetical protein
MNTSTTSTSDELVFKNLNDSIRNEILEEIQLTKNHIKYLNGMLKGKDPNIQDLTIELVDLFTKLKKQAEKKLKDFRRDLKELDDEPDKIYFGSKEEEKFPDCLFQIEGYVM